jgi:hypothetical protein
VAVGGFFVFCVLYVSSLVETALWFEGVLR